MEWLLSVSDHIVELIPSWQTFPDGSKLEVQLDWMLIYDFNFLFNKELSTLYVTKTKTVIAIVMFIYGAFYR